jgi:putative ABC transport system permease protein
MKMVSEWPVGMHIRPAGEQRWRTVVGVVGDVRQYSLSKNLPDWIAGAVYMPYAQATREDRQIPAAMTLLVKVRGDSEFLAGQIRGLAQDQAPNAPVGQAQSLEEIVSGSISNFRATIRVFIGFAGAALLLAAIGIYGLVSYWVAQRTCEIGVRMAMGATKRRIVSMIMTQGIGVTLCGIGGGVVAAFGMTRYLASLLYGVTAEDPVTFAVVIGIVLGVAASATAFPAWRASRIDPVRSLRAE